MNIHKKILVVIILTLFVSSCNKISFKIFNQNLKISGQASSLVGKITAGNIQGLQPMGANDSCTIEAYATLYKVSENGDVDRTQVLGKELLGADAIYNFILPAQALSQEDLVQVEISGCHEEFLEKRLVTDFNSKQNINNDSTFVTDIINNSTYNINLSKINNLKQLIVDLDKNQNNEIAKEVIIQNIVGDNKADALKKIKPEIFIEIKSLIARENEATNLKAFVHHPDPNFSANYIWSVDDEELSNDKNFIYTPSKNSSGQRKVNFEVINQYSPGNDVEKTLNLQVLNNFPIEIPSFNIRNDLMINNYILTNNLLVEVIASMGCETYTKFLVTDNNLVPPAESYIYDCEDVSVPLNLVNQKEGENLLYFWAKDNEGNVQKAQISYFVDETLPEAQMILSKNKIKGGQSLVLSTVFLDNESGINDVILSFSDDDFLTENVIATLTNSGSMNWTAPVLNKLLKFKLRVTDNVGNEKEVFADLTVDITAPVAPVLSLLSDNNTRVASIEVQISGCATGDRYFILGTLSTLTPSAPSENHSGWKNCSQVTFQESLLAIGDGNNAIYAWLKDEVGNISLISNKLSAYIDQTSPQFLQAPSIGNGVKPGSEHQISWVVYDLSQPIKLSYRLCDSNSCAPYIVSDAVESSITNLEKTITAPSVEKNGLYLEYSATDSLGNTSSGKSYFNVDFTSPTIESILTNNGNKYAITSVIPLLIDIEDGDNPLGMKVHITSLDLLNESLYDSTSCPATVDVSASWIEWKSTEEILFNLDMKEGAKKLCVFAQDGAGNISDASSGLIVYEKQNLPKVQEFYVYKTNPSDPLDKTLYNYQAGENVNIQWSIYDAEGFGTKDVALSYSLDGITWLDVATQKNVNDLENITWHESSIIDANNRQGSYTSFKAPACVSNPVPSCQQFFRIKIFAKDRSQTFSLPVMSGPQNSGRWSVFAGTEDRGVNGQALGASLRMSGNLFQNLIKVDHKTGNMYLSDITYGLRKYDVKTGVISSLFDIDVKEELKLEGTFTTSFRANVNAGINFIPINDHQLLLFLRDPITSDGYLYFVDYQTKSYRRILGGGNGRDLSSPMSFAVLPQVLERDENGLLYMMQPCDTSIFESNTGNTEIIRVKMNPDFSFTQREVVVGNCGGNTFNYSLGMNSEDFVYKHQYVYFTEFKVINSNYFYLGPYGKPYYKIINKKVYVSSMVSPSYPNLAYDKINNIIYTKNTSQGIKRYKINPLDGQTAEVDLDASEYVKSLSASYQPGCNSDGTHKDSACILAMDLATGPNGELYFVDGTMLNSNSNYIVKTVNQENVLKNVAGSLSFYGDGLHKSLVRGRIGGIHYNKEAFGQVSKALYLVSPDMIFGRIGEDNIYHTLFGNQIGLNHNIPAETVISSELSMGAPYSGGEGFSIAFDNENIYLRLMAKIGRIDKDLKFKFLHNYSTSTSWDLINESSDIRTANLSPYGGYQNLIVKDNKFIFAGTYIVFGNSSYDNRIPQISLFDFDSNLKTYLMGFGNTFSQKKTFSNFLSADSVRNTPYSFNCVANGCKLFYDKNTDRLYIVGREDGVIRYITNPYLADGIEPTKGIIPNVEMNLEYKYVSGYSPDLSNISNFTVSEDSSQLFYLTKNGLFCAPLTPAGVRAWCNNENLYPYEKELGIFHEGPNAMTWKDEHTLLISNFLDKVLQFDLPE